MTEAATGRLPGRAVVSALLGYVVALQLIVTGLAGAADAARSLDLLAGLDPHVLCLTGAPDGSPERGDGSGSGSAHRHQLCCTPAGSGLALLAPTAFAAAALPAVTAAMLHPTRDLGVRPPAAPPGAGGPRAPPTDLV
jgi:hypothetical protein